MDAKPAFSYDQIQQYAARRQRAVRIDHPQAEVFACFVVGGPKDRTVYFEQSLIIQANVPGRASVVVAEFKCAYTSDYEKSWWIPVDAKIYSEFASMKFYPL